MARIRSIKPEFWTSEQVMNLSASARLAFIGLWTFCDDGGNHPASAKTLKAEVFPSDDVTSVGVQALVDELLQQALVVVYDVDGKQYWHVTGWHHQRIDKPTIKHPALAASSPRDLIEVAELSSTPTRGLAESSPSTTGGLTPGVEGIGVERSGDDGIGADTFQLGADAPQAGHAVNAVPAKQVKPKAPPVTGAVWEAYRSAFSSKYGTDPVRNQKVNSQLAQLVARLGDAEAPEVAAFYVDSQERFYVSAGHTVDWLLKDAEKLRTLWKTGQAGAGRRGVHGSFDRVDYSAEVA